jgi:Kef-type K+ transport system membrane component KefB
MLADHPIVVVFLAAVAAPLIAQTQLGGRLPVGVFEVLQPMADQVFLACMREVGMVALIFMAGMEIDFARIRGQTLALGAAGAGRRRPRRGDIGQAVVT